MEHIVCAICGPSKTAVLARKGIFEKNGPVIKFTNIICRNCGLVYRSPRESADELNEIYKSIYLEKRHSLKDAETAEEFISKLDPKNKGEQIHDFLKDLLDKNSEILDIGSGLGLIGGFLHQKFGYKTKGIEPSELSARVSEKKYGMPVFHGTLDTFLASQAVTNKFDCIILHHVFEHFADPIQRLKELQGILSEKGILYIEVPNILDFKKPITQFFDFLHLYNYSPATLGQVLKAGGYKVIKWNRDKKFRIQVVAAPLSHQDPEIVLHGKEGTERAKYIINYCRKKMLIEFLNRLLNPFRRIKRLLK